MNEFRGPARTVGRGKAIERSSNQRHRQTREKRLACTLRHECSYVSRFYTYSCLIYFSRDAVPSGDERCSNRTINRVVSVEFPSGSCPARFRRLPGRGKGKFSVCFSRTNSRQVAFQRRDGKNFGKLCDRGFSLPRNSLPATRLAGIGGNRPETRSTSNYREERRDFLLGAIIGKESRPVPVSRGVARIDRTERIVYIIRLAGACYNYYIEKREQSELTAHQKLTCVPLYSEYVFSILCSPSLTSPVPFRTEGPPTSGLVPARLAFSSSVRSFLIETTSIVQESSPL